MVARAIGRAWEREAIRDLVSRLDDATNLRERSKRGTREFRAADEARRRYRHILLDDELFERFISPDGGPAAERTAERSPGLSPRARVRNPHLTKRR